LKKKTTKIPNSNKKGERKIRIPWVFLRHAKCKREVNPNCAGFQGQPSSQNKQTGKGRRVVGQG